MVSHADSKLHGKIYFYELTYQPACLRIQRQHAELVRALGGAPLPVVIRPRMYLEIGLDVIQKLSSC
jgi:hypothetical protein